MSMPNESNGGHGARDSGASGPTRRVRLRPRWHRALGGPGLAAGMVVIVLDVAMLFDPSVPLLPFGPSALYLLSAVVVAGSSSWLLGLFDRGRTVFR